MWKNVKETRLVGEERMRSRERGWEERKQRVKKTATPSELGKCQLCISVQQNCAATLLINVDNLFFISFSHFVQLASYNIDVFCCDFICLRSLSVELYLISINCNMCHRKARVIKLTKLSLWWRVVDLPMTLFMKNESHSSKYHSHIKFYES